MRLPLLVTTVLLVSVVSSLCTAMVCLRLSPPPVILPPTAQAPAPAPAPRTLPPALVTPAPRATPAVTAPHPEVASAQAVPAEEPSTIPPPPPPLDEVIPPPPEAPAPYYSGRARVIPAAPAAAPVAEAAPAPAPEDSTPIYVQHEVNDVIYRDYYGCTQAEVVVINTCQRCYQFHHADVLAVCLVARWAGIPLSVAFRTLYDDDHGSIQALVAGYHLNAGIFFVALPADQVCPGPYQRPYQQWRTLRGGEASYSNDEYRALIALKIACDFQGRQPSQFFAAVQHGDAPSQAIYRNPTALPPVTAHSWSGSALHPPSPGAPAAVSDHRQPLTATPVNASAHPAGDVEASSAAHSGPLHGGASHPDQPVHATLPARSDQPMHADQPTRTDQPTHADQPAHGDQPAHKDAQEHLSATATEAGKGSVRPSGLPIERRTSEPANEHPAQGQASHDAVSAQVPAPAPAPRQHAEPAAPAQGAGVQATAPAGGQAPAAGAASSQRHPGTSP